MPDSSTCCRLNTDHKDVALVTEFKPHLHTDEHDGHNILNPMLELLCYAHVGVLMEEDSGRIALSCHFALDILCDKE